MDLLRIEDVKPETIDSLISLCIPPEKMNDQHFIEGFNLKRVWASKSIERFGSIAKIAYLDNVPVGLIQYVPRPSEKVLEITCIFVPNRRNQRKGVGKALLNSLIEEAKNPKKYFGNESALALVAWTFQVLGYYPMNEFYMKMGFKKAGDEHPDLFYYPLKEGYVYRPEEGRFIPQEEDKGKALIFYDPSCPFCIYFTEKIRSLIAEAAPDIPIRTINMFEEAEEVEKRGTVPICAVNGKPITTFFADKEKFQREVKEALGPALKKSQ